MSPPDEETCAHEKQFVRGDGIITCLICDHEFPPPDLVEQVEGSPRDLFAQARAKIAKARELEPTDDDRPAA